ncbi:hypothetical protein T02_1550 [Trichinella nativa]|uniref:Uncharacterized protein n=1 Tax=Trichinella nativa TaxID=6335 RepID=A0A0V1L2J8_9BILA|nr:hypothetical protein T02_1550 [Trichinella nativa]
MDRLNWAKEKNFEKQATTVNVTRDEPLVSVEDDQNERRHAQNAHRSAYVHHRATNGFFKGCKYIDLIWELLNPFLT